MGRGRQVTFARWEMGQVVGYPLDRKSRLGFEDASSLSPLLSSPCSQVLPECGRGCCACAWQ